MRILKGVFTFVAVAAIILLAGQNFAYGAGGQENIWAVNSSATGVSAKGYLTMYGQDVDSTVCTDPYGDDRILPRIMMRLEISRVLHIFTFVSDKTLCHPSEYGEGETVALHQFLKEVLVEYTGGTASSPYADCVVDPFGLYFPGPDDPSACPNILKSMDNVIDTEGQDGPLVLMSDVELKFPR